MLKVKKTENAFCDKNEITRNIKHNNEKLYIPAGTVDSIRKYLKNMMVNKNMGK